MGRPKPVRKPSRRAQARREKKALRRRLYVHGDDRFYAVSNATGGAGGSYTITGVNWSSAAYVDVDSTAFAGTITVASSASRPMFPTRQIVIESLDEGVTWHTIDTLEPAANINGRLVIGTAPCGQAPDCMRAGSGTYRFEITSRSATDEEARQWLAENAERAERTERNLQQSWREERERAKRADARARELLLSHLSPSQRRDLEARGGFWVTSQFGNRYWVTRRTAVRFDDRGSALQRYCIHAVDPLVPDDDNALSRMLLLKCDEERFLSTANPGTPSKWDVRSGGHTGARPQEITIAENPVAMPSVTIAHDVGRSTALVPMRPEQTAVVAVPESEWIIPVDAVRVDPDVDASSSDERFFVTASSTASTYMSTAALNGWRIVPVGPPFLLWVNGVVRPLCG